jgi:hypothetical protein
MRLFSVFEADSSRATTPVRIAVDRSCSPNPGVLTPILLLPVGKVAEA